jgi:hypothetical protein
MLRYLRIAVTVLSLTACVLLIALWVRSFFGHDFVFKRLTTREMTVQISRGALIVWTTPNPPAQLPYDDSYWSIGRDWNRSNDVSYLMPDGTRVKERFGFRFGSSPRATVACVPFGATVPQAPPTDAR